MSRQRDRKSDLLIMAAGAATGAAIGRMTARDDNVVGRMIAGAVVGAAAAYVVAPMIENQVYQLEGTCSRRLLLSSS
jgi:gas vesicle protein